jgi:hypothetical protein
MLAGHVGAALAIGRVDRKLNIGILVFAALLLDCLLWLFVLIGWETATIAADFGNTHQAAFVFPYSHGWLSSIGWSALAGAVTLAWYARRQQSWVRPAACIAAAVHSHWLLDALVHAPELPIAGVSSPKLGLGLWQMMPLAIACESVITLAGLYLFLSGANLSRTRQLWLAVLVLVVLAFTIAGMTVAPPPPSATAMAAGSLFTIGLVVAIACWLGRAPARGLLAKNAAQSR